MTTPHNLGGINPATPPAAKPKNNYVRIGVIILTGLIVVLAVVYGPGLLAKISTDELMKVGNCVTFNGSDDNPKIAKTQCADSKKTPWQVIQVMDQGKRCGDDFIEYYIQDGKKIIGSYCLQPILKANTCYSDMNKITTFDAVNCTETTAEFKVSSRKEGTTESTCATDETALFFKGMNVTYCLAAPK